MFVTGCDIIVNPWTADGVQARYRGSGADGRVYRTFEMTVSIKDFLLTELYLKDSAYLRELLGIAFGVSRANVNVLFTKSRKTVSIT